MQNQQTTPPRKPVLSLGGRRDEDEFMPSFIAMLNVLRKYYDQTGDLMVKPIIDKAERALASR
jgi:hypothetical protein